MSSDVDCPEPSPEELSAALFSPLELEAEAPVVVLSSAGDVAVDVAELVALELSDVATDDVVVPVAVLVDGAELAEVEVAVVPVAGAELDVADVSVALDVLSGPEVVSVPPPGSSACEQAIAASATLVERASQRGRGNTGVFIFISKFSLLESVQRRQANRVARTFDRGCLERRFTSQCQ